MVHFYLIDSYVDYSSVNKKYKLHKQPMNWLDAVARCHSECAKLAMPENKYEKEILKTISQSFSHGTTMTGGQKINILLGFHDHFSEGQFVTELGKISLYYICPNLLHLKEKVEEKRFNIFILEFLKNL